MGALDFLLQAEPFLHRVHQFLRQGIVAVDAKRLRWARLPQPAND